MAAGFYMKEVIKVKKIFMDKLNSWKAKQKRYKMLKQQDRDSMENDLIELMRFEFNDKNSIKVKSQLLIKISRIYKRL